jgi:hypothetical protein
MFIIFKSKQYIVQTDTDYIKKREADSREEFEKKKQLVFNAAI